QNLVGGAKIAGGGLAHAPGNASAGQVVGGEFDPNDITEHHAHIALAHLTGEVGQHFVAVFQFHHKVGVGQRLNHGAFQLQYVVFLLQAACSLDLIYGSGTTPCTSIPVP